MSSRVVSRRLLVLYGSQEGCAESVAQRIAKDANMHFGWDVDLAPANQYKRYIQTRNGNSGKEQRQFIVIVCSTTGNGDPPDNCDRFWRYLKRRTHTPETLMHVSFAVLGLGDSNYDKFCHMGKGIDKKMSALGGRRLHSLGCADDGVGLSIVIEPWISSLFPALEVAYKSAFEEGNIPPKISSADMIDSKKSMQSGDGAGTTIGSNSVSSVNLDSEKATVSHSPTTTDADGSASESANASRSRGYELPLPVSSKVRPNDSGQRRRTHLVSDGEHRLVVLYGRKGDQYPEKDVAEALAATAADRYGWTVKVLPCGKYRRTGIDGGFVNERTVVVALPMTSSVLTDDCQRFLRYIGRSSHSSDFLTKMKYSIVSVGEPNMHFNGTGACTSLTGENYPLDLDSRLGAIGATRFAPLESVTRSMGADDPWCRVWAESYWNKFEEDTSEMGLDVKPSAVSSTRKFCKSTSDISFVTSTGVDQKQRTGSQKVSTALSEIETTLPQVPDRLRTLVDNCSGVGFWGVPSSDIVRRAQVVPLPRAVAPGFRCVFPSRQGQQSSPSGIRGRAMSSAASSGQSGPDSPQMYAKRHNEYTREHPFFAEISDASYLTGGGASASRRVIHMELCLLPDKMENPFISKRMIQYIPGDAVGIVVPNDEHIVTYILHRLSLMDVADEEFYFESDVAKQRDIAVGALPRQRLKAASTISKAYRTPRLALRHAIDLSAPPRRGFLRALADCCVGDANDHNNEDSVSQAEVEKSKLLLLSSRDGREEYDRIITKMHAGLPEILAMFPTCQPKLSMILGGMNPLMPRYYSVSSSPLKDPTKLCIAFTVVEYNVKLPTSGGSPAKVTRAGKSEESKAGVAIRPIMRRGLCTSWLERLSKTLLAVNELKNGISTDSKIATSQFNTHRSATSNSDIDFDGDEVGTTTTTVDLSHRRVRIPIFIRETKEFALPANHKYPIIMIGPGTGVAPFIGFLQHRQQQRAEQSCHKDDVCSGLWRGGFELEDLQDDDEYSGQKINTVYGECVLFFGNRNRKKDFLYKKQLNEFLEDGTLTRLHVAFSRDGDKKVYVQHKMLEQAAELYRMLVKENGYLYVCGDGMKMARDVERCLLMILSTRGGALQVKEGDTKAIDDAKGVIERMKKRGRYVKDVWS